MYRGVRGGGGLESVPLMTESLLAEAFRAQAQQARRQARRVAFWIAALVLVVALIYIVNALSLTGGRFLLPLDDAYIHLRYAETIAQGHPYQYNTGEAPTSGATSFLYPYLLAPAFLVAPQALDVAWWSVLIGIGALMVSANLVYHLVSALGGRHTVALLAALTFALNGALQWHALSGMETMLVVTFALLTWLGVARGADRLILIGAAGSALLRPEGALVLVAALVALLIRRVGAVPIGMRRIAFAGGRGRAHLILPVLLMGAVLVAQPVVNGVITGSLIASGGSAKSIFGTVPLDWWAAVVRVLENFVRLWTEFLLSFSIESGYLPFGGGIAALVGLAWLGRRRDHRLFVILLGAWLIGFAGAISTLDTAFWHFKRYQMPLLALLIPLAFVALEAGLRMMRRRPQQAAVLVSAAGMWAVTTSVILALTWCFFNYRANISAIYEQPYQMALVLRALPDRNTRVAVHDVGLMRLWGGLNTVDMVGLTTAGGAESWRNGPGAVGEFLERTRPDLIAAYGVGHGLGLGYLEATDLYAEVLARYSVRLDPALNVALAADTQGIFRPDWAAAERAERISDLTLVTPYLAGFTPITRVDVADLASERVHTYRWTAPRPLQGFPTEYNQFGLIGCVVQPCDSMDGGRHISGEESFTVESEPGRDLIMITRLHPAAAGSYAVYADEVKIAERMIPMAPGGWLDVPVLIADVPTAQTRIRIVPTVTGDYQPFAHTVFQGEYAPTIESGSGAATFDNGALSVTPTLTVENGQAGGRTLAITLAWVRADGDSVGAWGDDKRFIHVLNSDDQIVAQADGFLVNGMLPPGNLLPGAVNDGVRIDVSALPPGAYSVVGGLYDAVTGERPTPSGDSVDSVGRIIIIDRFDVE